MRILVSGARGLVGTALAATLSANGAEVQVLPRSFYAQPESTLFTGADVVVHLAGENIASERWTPERKSIIWRSRIETTKVLCETIASASTPPRVLICASAVGIYGDRGDEVLTESSAAGRGFLADVVRDWEAACAPARHAGIRVVNTRFGMIVSPQGGALAKMLPLFRWGLGAVLGSGKQWVSWVAIEDVVSAMIHCLEHHQMSGPVNVCSPNPVSNATFAKTLGHILHRPVWRAPAAVLRLLMGEMAQELLLSSQRAMPNKLIESGFQFQNATIESALTAAVAGKRP